MHTDAVTSGDGQLTQVGPDPLDYVLRYAVGDYDCYHQGRYVGSRATLPKAVAAVQDEQAKAARHPQSASAATTSIASYQEELRAIAARLHNLAQGLTSYPAGPVPMRAQLMMAHIRVSAALRSVQDAERSLGLAGQMTDVAAPLDAAA
jgi:hypothetical protein